MKQMRRVSILFVLFFLLLPALACNFNSQPEATPTLFIPTPPVPTATVTSAPPSLEPVTVAPPAATLTVVPSATSLPTGEPVSQVTNTPAPAIITPAPTRDTGATYRVVYVAVDDVLNVRSGPGVTNPVLSTLSPGASGVSLSANTATAVGASQWVAIQAGGASGWVNDVYLTEVVDAAQFCQDAAARAALDAFIAQVRQQSTTVSGTAQPLHMQRGLHVRVNWWNPEVWLSGTTLQNVYADAVSRSWGIADGSGLPIQGSFNQVIMPLLQRDLLGGSQVGCNVILHGGTAGLVQLPQEYAGINFFSVHRPPVPGGIEMDWGTWVVGVERWQGQYYVSFLVHFQWEI